MNILFLDFETSGYSKTNFEDRSNKYQYQIVSIGAVVVDSVKWQEIDHFYTEIQWNLTSKWDNSAQQVHGLSREHLEEHGVPEEEAFGEFCVFVSTYFDPAKAITLGGHNVATFDRHFLVQLFDKYNAQIKLGGRTVDTYTLGQVLFGTSDSTELFELLGISRGDHNALEDARMAAKVARLTNRLFVSLSK